jgi:hypothetical protein
VTRDQTNRDLRRALRRVRPSQRPRVQAAIAPQVAHASDRELRAVDAVVRSLVGGRTPEVRTSGWFMDPETGERHRVTLCQVVDPDTGETHDVDPWSDTGRALLALESTAGLRYLHFMPSMLALVPEGLRPALIRAVRTLLRLASTVRPAAAVVWRRPPSERPRALVRILVAAPRPGPLLPAAAA